MRLEPQHQGRRAVSVRVALVGDYNPAHKAHQAIPGALALAAGEDACEYEWLPTSELRNDPREQLASYDAVWCVPGSPYANARGVIETIRAAREEDWPFLGTCGGFQHALLEYAEAIWHVADPRHAETDPAAIDPVIAPLVCSLVEVSGEIFPEPDSHLATIYASGSAFEGYHCSYGINPRYVDRLAAGPLRIAARDAIGEVRAVELDGHPFFIGTLFQPERSALTGQRHPLIAAFIAAAARARREAGSARQPYRQRSASTS